MKNKLIIAAVVCVVLFVGYGFWTLAMQGSSSYSDTGQYGVAADGVSSSGSSDRNNSSDGVIRYTDSGFEFENYKVKNNKPVKVVNLSSRTLEFSSDSHPTHQINRELNLEPIEPGGEMVFTPNKTGSWGIHDHLRSSATTTLEVE